MASTPPALVIRKHFPRPTAEQLAAFTSTQTGFVVDAQGRRGALNHRIRPLSQAVRFCGVALTVQSRARDNLACWAALDACRPGDVVLIAVDEYEEASVVGDVYVAMARNNGVVACVTDGMVRDIRGINEAGIPVFAKGLSPNSPFKDGPGEIGTAITLGGVHVGSGDIVLGDEDGVVVVPYANIDQVIKDLAQVQAKEAVMEAGVKKGDKTPPWLQQALAAKGVRYIGAETS
ncbi:RraA family protein [Pollutimonas sp. H1-120]|uniref:RraA family protein n=1 Tax=Pollutimonas sp. H1-120 TaxID=3148824 RepID=UPI003B523883